MTIRWTKRAIRSLVSIDTFISKDSPAAAARVAATILDAIAQLERFPQSGRPGRIEGTRELVVHGIPYIIPYRIVDEVILLLSVMHTSRQQPLGSRPRHWRQVSVDSLCPDSWHEEPRRARLFCRESLHDLGYCTGGYSGTTPADCEGARGTARGEVTWESKSISPRKMSLSWSCFITTRRKKDCSASLKIPVFGRLIIDI